MTQELDKDTPATVQSRRVLARLLPYFIAEKRLVAIAAAGLLANAATQTAVPWLIKPKSTEGMTMQQRNGR